MFGAAKRGYGLLGKSKKTSPVIKSVKPSAGKKKTEEYLRSSQVKRNKAKITQSQMKVEKDIEEGYKSVKKDD
jgi:hypothetical protein